MTGKGSRRNYRICFKGKNVIVDYSGLKKMKESLTFEEVQELFDACETLEEKALIETVFVSGIGKTML